LKIILKSDIDNHEVRQGGFVGIEKYEATVEMKLNITLALALGLSLTLTLLWSLSSLGTGRLVAYATSTSRRK
jgi:hypothetical protein